MFSSSSESDLEVLQLLSDWDSDTDSDCTQNSDNITHRGRVNYMIELNDAEFTYRFRINKSAVTNLLVEVYPYLKTTSSRNNGIEPINQLLLTLRYYALGTMLESVADYVGVSISSACRIIGDVSNSIAQLYENHIRVDNGTPEEFKHIAGFPLVYGVIDCTHVLVHAQELKKFRDPSGQFQLELRWLIST